MEQETSDNDSMNVGRNNHRKALRENQNVHHMCMIRNKNFMMLYLHNIFINTPVHT